MSDLFGEQHLPAGPLVVSASRRCDIPAFAGKWLVNRFQEGYVDVKNPFNGKLYRVELAQVKLLVLWSKNPRPFLPRLHEFEKRGVRFYFQYTLNDYEETGWEPGLPSLDERVETFQKLAQDWGSDRVIWRFDPLMISSSFGVERLQEKIFSLGERLAGHTRKLIFSFVQVENYRKVKSRFRRNAVEWEDFTPHRRQMAEFLKKQARAWRMELGACCEPGLSEEFGIAPARCVDPVLADKLLAGDSAWERQKKRVRIDKGQRPGCQCMESRDIGSYDTCSYRCVYCYANR